MIDSRQASRAAMGVYDSVDDAYAMRVSCPSSAHWRSLSGGSRAAGAAVGLSGSDPFEKSVAVKFAAVSPGEVCFR